jgi:hypothetical protein
MTPNSMSNPKIISVMVKLGISNFGSSTEYRDPSIAQPSQPSLAKLNKPNYSISGQVTPRYYWSSILAPSHSNMKCEKGEIT